jgi:hypothetical protein
MTRGDDALHENFARPAPVAGSSNRVFGFVFAGFFALVAGYSWCSGGHWWTWYLTAAAAFGAVALAAPVLLAPLNRLWSAFGLLLHKVMNPLIMGVIFFGVVTPIGLLMRVLNKRPLDLRYHSTDATYWKKRPAEEPNPRAMTQQF